VYKPFRLLPLGESVAGGEAPFLPPEEAVFQDRFSVPRVSRRLLPQNGQCPWRALGLSLSDLWFREIPFRGFTLSFLRL